jgi:DNA-binding MarR family transcriptional regulator
VADEMAEAAGRCVEDDLGWGLGVVFRRYQKAATEAMSDLPISPRGYQVLSRATQGEPRRQLSLAHDLGIDRTVMTYLLDDLEQAGLVERRPDPNDRRARLVSATEAGNELLCDVQRALDAAEEQVLGALDQVDRAAFRTLLQKLAVDADRVDHVAEPCQVMDDVGGQRTGTKPDS